MIYTEDFLLEFMSNIVGSVNHNKFNLVYFVILLLYNSSILLNIRYLDLPYLDLLEQKIPKLIIILLTPITQEVWANTQRGY